MHRQQRARRARGALALAGLSLVSTSLTIVGARPAAADFATAQPGAAAKGDFNDDGYADLAIGVPLEGVTAAFQGAVEVIYGSEEGLDPNGEIPDQLLVQDGADPDDEGPEVGEGFGSAVAVGDFNGDGFGDLAVGTPAEDVGLLQNAGSVSVFYGSEGGLAGPSQYLLDVAVAADDEFGGLLAAGDFDDDGRDDLAVAAFFENLVTVDEGQVVVFPGRDAGLDESPAGLAVINQDTPGVADQAEGGDLFGAGMAAGDFDGDGRDDLAVAAPFESFEDPVTMLPTATSVGVVHVFPGCRRGSTCLPLVQTRNAEYIHQDSPGVKDAAETGDRFGFSLAAGDFGRSRKADLAVGIVGEDGDAGAVAVFYGTSDGLTTSGDEFLNQDTPGVKDEAEPGDAFGVSLAAGNVGKGRRADLAVGIPSEDLGPFAGAGAVAVLYGRSGGLTTSGDTFLNQDTDGVDDEVEANEGFGFSLAIADFGHSDEGDLAIAASAEDVGPAVDAGVVHVVYGDDDDGVGDPADGPDASYFVQGVDGVNDVAEAFDRFGGFFSGLTG